MPLGGAGFFQSGAGFVESERVGGSASGLRLELLFPFEVAGAVLSQIALIASADFSEVGVAAGGIELAADIGPFRVGEGPAEHEGEHLGADFRGEVAEVVPVG